MKKTMRTMVIFFIVMALAAGLAGAAEESPLCNSDIIKLSKLAMGDKVIITKIKTAKEVKFDTSTDNLAELKISGVSGPVIAAMLERSVRVGSGNSSTTRSLSPTVALIAKDGNLEINPISGSLKSIVAPFVGYRRFIEFAPNGAATRVKDRFPSLQLNADGEPHEAMWLVKLSRWDDSKILVLDLQSPGMWGGVISNDPEEDLIIPYSAIEEKPGLWRITPKMELKPGDYGLFRWGHSNSSKPILVGFGIDK